MCKWAFLILHKVLIGRHRLTYMQTLGRDDLVTWIWVSKRDGRSEGLVVVGLIILRGRAAVTNAFGDDQPDHDAATKCKGGE